MSNLSYNDTTLKKEDIMSPKLREVVDFFIIESEKDNRPLTNKKLQKLIYYAQAWNLVFNDAPLFDDAIEAWIHGPVVPSVYRTYKKFGKERILEPEANFDEKQFSSKEVEVLKDVWDAYGKFDGDYLEMLSHSEDPWASARGDAELSEKSTAVIDTNLMKNYYRNKLELANMI